MFHSDSRSLQQRFGTDRIARRIEEKFRSEVLDEGNRAFIERADMFFLATADAEGRPTCSYKGGDPGFVRVVDETTLAFPNYDGNGMYLSTGNTLANPAVGLLFIDFEKGHRLRLHGDAELHFEDLLLPHYPEAQFMVRVKVREVFPNCPRYIHRYQLVERSGYVPHEDRSTPVPAWKKDDWAKGYLPEEGPAEGPAEG
ncbi:MAG: pyridoxamine 5'-phosphate oxidase family protein [Actinomycetota bacterium]